MTTKETLLSEIEEAADDHAYSSDSFEALNIPVQFTAELQSAYLDYLIKIGSQRPFARSPLARESFFAGYWFASQRYTQ